MSDNAIQDTLGLDSGPTDGPVECLGQTFESDRKRREHYLELLRERLKDPEFRNQPGFPIGEDENILALSDPPYYTVCPNPWLNEFATFATKPKSKEKDYFRDPFATDVSEGKRHPVYGAHAYHTKVPHRAIMRYILHYTEPGDLVLDFFSGTGMTAVAANLCNSEEEIKKLGYQIDRSGAIYDHKNKISKIGRRNSILSELSPIATFISNVLNSGGGISGISARVDGYMQNVKEECEWMYTTSHDASPETIERLAKPLQTANSVADAKKRVKDIVGNSQVEFGKIEYVIWSQVFSCPHCGDSFNFWDTAVDEAANQINSAFQCPSCSSELTKRQCDIVNTSIRDVSDGSIRLEARRDPILIAYTYAGQHHTKRADELDFSLAELLNRLEPDHWYPSARLIKGGETRRNDKIGITHEHHFYFGRTLHVLSSFRHQVEKGGRINDLAILTGGLLGLTKLQRYRPGSTFPNMILSGTYYVGSINREWNALSWLLGKKKNFDAASRFIDGRAMISTQSSESIDCSDECLDYIFVDPPFGANLAYSELNNLWEGWIKVRAATSSDAIINKPQDKSADDYKQLLKRCFSEAFRLLKPGRWMTVEFSNSKASVWNTIQTTLQEAGFIVATVSALDKQQKSFKAVNTPTAVKQDLAISAYKPSAQLELNFHKNADSPEGVWGFVDHHLQRIPIPRIVHGQMEFVLERDPRILFDRTVAFFVCHNAPVPISSPEFQAEIHERYAERDGMVFLVDQVAGYDSSRAKLDEVGQLTIFVEDEKSAIEWLRTFLKRRPSVYKDVQPEFLKQLGISWKKWEDQEKLADLNFLLNQGFLQYKGEGPVPSQIHNYLSTQFKDLRKLDKEDPKLKAKAMDRWYVPDPSKQKDMDELRERSLLEAFWSYLPPNYVPPALSASTGGDDLPGLKFQIPKIPKIPKGKKMKELRTEAIRAGFRFCYQKKDYQTMLVAAQIIPDAVIEEDEQLQMLYDTAVTRSGVED